MSRKAPQQRPRTSKGRGAQEIVQSINFDMSLTKHLPVRVSLGGSRTAIALWSGLSQQPHGLAQCPQLGVRVVSAFDRSKKGIVVGYFVEANYLGIRVMLDNHVEARMFGNEARLAD